MYIGNKHSWAAIAFLCVFALLLAIVCSYFLLPAADAARTADASGRHQIAAYSRLLLTIILFILFVGLTLTFRTARFFFPRPGEKRSQTTYTDAWAESAKRMKLPPDDPE
jgi:predicted MFS family arabinose efflux permease